MFVRTCIFVRSCAIVKMTGAWKEAATVWPTSYWRSTTTPSIGDRIFAYERFVSDCLSAASLCATAAAAASRFVWAASSSDCARSCCFARFFERARESSVLRSSTFDFSRSARRWSTLCWKGVGSSSARSWPFFTVELKST